ncbi:hypothetical protein [Jannaschia rubra]|uniref:hypothetical protein n=1 Tax=Jannaschia rubra TaxID=282197 RepID=UPI0006E28F0C|nr:hypothetical protein [Jannaschia rubra]
MSDRDVDRTEMLIGLAADLGHEVDTAPAIAMIEEQSGWWEVTRDCGACMADVAQCASLSMIGACAVPFEMSPLGDLNALRREGTAYLAGDPVDEVNAGLAIVGLGATAAIAVTGGSSATIKAGTGLLRLARRMGSLTPELARLLRVPIRWDAVPGWLRGAAPLSDVTDVARLERLGTVAADFGRVREATSTAEALRLARHVDGPEDAARLARVAEAAGPRTTRSFAVLGKARVFRATVRLSRAAAGTLLLIWLSLAQVAAVLGTRTTALLLRWLAPKPVDRRRGAGQS